MGLAGERVLDKPDRREKENRRQKKGPARHTEPQTPPGEAEEEPPNAAWDEEAGGSKRSGR